MIDFQKFIESIETPRTFQIHVVDRGGNLVDTVEVEAGPEDSYININVSSAPDPRSVESVKIGYGQKPYENI